uniref:Bahd acyltransferase n=1 Tax=Sphaerodactylus townsendi TaxID=933632 RepID=A0ACB8FFK7_9SAUR
MQTGYQCSCLSQFTGRNCKSEITACFPNPCRNGGSCDPIGGAFICSCKSGLTGVTCEEDINECEREECENGGSCVNVFGSFLCNCTPGYVGQHCGLRPVVVPNIQAGHSYVGKEELIGIAVVLFVIFVLVVLFVVFRKKVFRKNYSRNNITLVQDPATATLLHKSNGIQFKNMRNSGDGRNIYQEVGPPQVPVRPMAYTPCFQSDSRNNLDKIVDGLGVEHQEMTTFHPESPRILTARRGVVVCSVAPNLPAVSPCRSDCDSIRKTWENGTEGKGADDVEEVTCFSGSNKGSNSEVQSLSSYQSDSGDDNGTHGSRARRGSSRCSPRLHGGRTLLAALQGAGEALTSRRPEYERDPLKPSPARLRGEACRPGCLAARNPLSRPAGNGGRSLTCPAAGQAWYRDPLSPPCSRPQAGIRSGRPGRTRDPLHPPCRGRRVLRRLAGPAELGGQTHHALPCRREEGGRGEQVVGGPRRWAKWLLREKKGSRPLF